jgi:hypothetical protein
VIIKAILHVETEEDLILAGRAIKFMMQHPDRKDAILTYGDDNKNVFYTKRNKASITARRSYG